MGSSTDDLEMVLSAAPVCPVCAKETGRFHSISTDRRRGLQGKWAFWQCQGCGVLFQHPLPTHRQLQALYEDYSVPGVTAPKRTAPPRLAQLRPWYHWATGDVDPRDFIEVRPGTRILDCGCGGGAYLRYFSAQGAVASGTEISPSTVAAHRAAGLDVALVENMEVIPFPDDEFDIVYLMQVIEHLPNPHRFLAEVRRILRSSGRLYLAMPNGASFWRTVFGKHWVTGWFAPFHLFVYTLPGIQALARAEGFRMINATSKTPESWFRLNLKAVIYSTNNTLDSSRKTWLDTVFLRGFLMLFLRFIGIFVRERDCLVVQLEKR